MGRQRPVPPRQPPPERPAPTEHPFRVERPEPRNQNSDPDTTEVIPNVGTRRSPTPVPPGEGSAPEWLTETPGSASAPRAVGNPGLTRVALNRSRRRKRLRKAGRAIVALVAVGALAGTGTVWGYLNSTMGKFGQVAALDTESEDIVDALGQMGDETYLIVGTDTRAGASGQIGAGTVEDAEGARADVVMLVNIPADRSRVVAVSFPRDLDVERPACQGWDNETGTYVDTKYPAAYGDKLNATYALGGPKCLVKVIQKMSGLKIGHFVSMDFAGFESMVDEIGGVEVCTEQPLHDGILGTVIPEAGTHLLDGKTALDFVRARHVATEGTGDYGRINRQQIFLSSLLGGALSSQVLLNPAKLNGFINAFTSETFVENVDAESLITLGRSLQNVDAGAVTFLTVPTAGTNDWGNEIPRMDDIKAIFRAIIDDDDLPGEKRAEPILEAAPEPQPQSVQTVDPSSVNVQVSNATGEAGLAATVAADLEAEGFQIYDVGNYLAGNTDDTVVRFSPTHEAEAATLASSFPGAVLESAKGLGTVIEVALGSNFSGNVQTPIASDTPVNVSDVRIGKSVGAEIPTDLAVVNAGDVSC